MGARQWYQDGFIEGGTPYGLVHVRGSFVPLTGSGTVVASTVKGWGFGYGYVSGAWTLNTAPRSGLTGTCGIVRTSTGLYTITCDDTYPDLWNLWTELQVPAAGPASMVWAHPVTLPTVGSATAVSSFQVLLVNSSGTPTDAPASCRVNFDAVFRNSNVNQGKP